jgi:large subunit ribosomal protein L22
MTRKEKISAGIAKLPRQRKARMAAALREERASIAKVSLNNFGITPRKMRLIVDQIRGMEVFQALAVLKFTPKAGAPAVAKLVKAGISSYQEKFEEDRVNVGTHKVGTVFVDGGRVLKRMQPAPQGRGHIIRKRTSHVTLVIERI